MTGRSAFTGELPLPEDHTLEAWQRWLERFRDRTALGPHGVELISADDSHVALSMEIGDHARQPYGLLHGGMSMLLAESAASLHACWKVDLTQRVPVGIEINGSHVNSIREGTVIARAEELRRSRRFAHHIVEIREVRRNRLLSTIRVTNFYQSLPGAADG